MAKGTRRHLDLDLNLNQTLRSDATTATRHQSIRGHIHPVTRCTVRLRTATYRSCGLWTDHDLAKSILFIMAIIGHGSFAIKSRRFPALSSPVTLVSQPQQRKMADDVHVQGARLARWAS